MYYWKWKNNTTPKIKLLQKHTTLVVIWCWKHLIGCWILFKGNLIFPVMIVLSDGDHHNCPFLQNNIFVYLYSKIFIHITWDINLYQFQTRHCHTVFGNKFKCYIFKLDFTNNWSLMAKKSLIFLFI